ncbi:MAG: hypothetical protein CMI64_16310 [Pedosphaera sp.]|nr:hypothetical protein [Pedosphaera sp.]
MVLHNAVFNKDRIAGFRHRETIPASLKGDDAHHFNPFYPPSWGGQEWVLAILAAFYSEK